MAATATVLCSAFAAIASINAPQPSLQGPCCCARASQLGFKDVLSIRDTGSLRREATFKEVQFQRRNCGVSSSSLATDASSSSSSSSEASADPVAVDFEGVGSRSGLGSEERDAIMAFEGLNGESDEEGDASLQTITEEKAEGKAKEKAEEEEEEDKQIEKTRLRRSKMYARPKRVVGRGATIADIITLYMVLLDRPVTGDDGRLIAAAGSAVLERLVGEVEEVRGSDGVDEQYLFELLRVVKLLQMDFQLISAARKNSTLFVRLNQAKAHCQQILDIASIL